MLQIIPLVILAVQQLIQVEHTTMYYNFRIAMSTSTHPNQHFKFLLITLFFDSQIIPYVSTMAGSPQLCIPESYNQIINLNQCEICDKTPTVSTIQITDNIFTNPVATNYYLRQTLPQNVTVLSVAGTAAVALWHCDTVTGGDASLIVFRQRRSNGKHFAMRVTS